MEELTEYGTWRKNDGTIITLLGLFKDRLGTEIAVVNRHTKFQPYVVAWCWNGLGSWGQGHYLDTFEDAIAFAYERYIQPKETEEL